MRRILLVTLLLAADLLLLAPSAFAKAPAAKASAAGATPVEPAFGSLLGAAVPDADLVLLLDVKALGRGVLDLLDFVEGTPLMSAAPDVQAEWRQARAAVMSAFSSVTATLGADPLRDLDKAVATVRLLPEGGDHQLEISLTLTGKLPPDVVNRLSPDLPSLTVAGVQVSDLGATPAGPLVAGFVAPDRLLLASPAVFEKALASKAPARELVARHEGLLAKSSGGLLFRLSLVLPDWLRAKVAEVPELEAFPFARGLARLRLELDQSLYVELAGATDAAAESARLLLEGAREGLVGSRALARSLALMALSLDLAKLPEVPAEWRPLLANRIALQASIDRFLGGADLKAPEVAAKGRVASLKTDRLQLLSAALPLGVVAAVAIPAFERFKEKAEQAAPTPPAGGPVVE